MDEINLSNDPTGINLAGETTPTDLSTDVSNTTCVIKSGETVWLLSDGSALRMDGTVIPSLQDCTLQVGSSFMIRFGDAVEKMNNNKLKHKEISDVLVPSSPTPVYDNTIPTVQVASERSYKKTSTNFGIDPIMAAIFGLAAISAITVSSLTKSARLKKEKILERLTQRNNKREEEQSKCNSKSENVKSLISEVDVLLDSSFLNQVQPNTDDKFKTVADDISSDLSKINKTLRSLEDKLSKTKR